MSVSQIVSDTPLLSPSDAPWDHQHSPYSTSTFDALGWSYYTLPPSPPTSDSSNTTDSPISATQTPQLRSPRGSFSEGERHQCLPTHQVFDLQSSPRPSSSSTSPPPTTVHKSSFSSNITHPAKRPFSVAGVAKKPRGSGERITTKDFIPPDVSGLSKREARLVKNRAAAFLSRQRKREEFEAMEIRVKELEEENARLSAIVVKGSTDNDPLSEIEQLRLRLSAAEKRERELSEELSRKSFIPASVKTESQDHVPVSLQSASASWTPALGLMKQALLRALPSLLSMSSQSPLPVTVSVPLQSSTAARTSIPNYGHEPPNAEEPERRHCAQGDSGIIFDSACVEALERVSAIGTEFCSDGPLIGPETLHALGGLEVSFDTSSAEEGRIQVHIRSSERYARASAGGSVGVKTSDRAPSSPLGAWPGPEANVMGKLFAQQPFALAPPPVPSNAPSSANHIDHLRHFFGSGPHANLGLETLMTPSTYSSAGLHLQDQLFGHYTGYLEPFVEDPARHRTRGGWKGSSHINEGEWEVQVC